MYKNTSQNLVHAASGFTKKIQNGLSRDLTIDQQIDSLSLSTTRLHEMARLKDYRVYSKETLGQKIQEIQLKIVELRALKKIGARNVQDFFLYFLRKRVSTTILKEASLQADRAYEDFNGDFDLFQSTQSKRENAAKGEATS